MDIEKEIDVKIRDLDESMQLEFRKDFVIWLIISIVIAIIFARNSNGMCEYLFLTISYLFIIYITTSIWKRFEFKPNEQAMITAAALGGWLIGTFIIWRHKGKNKFFS